MKISSKLKRNESNYIAIIDTYDSYTAQQAILMPMFTDTGSTKFKDFCTELSTVMLHAIMTSTELIEPLSTSVLHDVLNADLKYTRSTPMNNCLSLYDLEERLIKQIIGQNVVNEVQYVLYSRNNIYRVLINYLRFLDYLDGISGLHAVQEGVYDSFDERRIETVIQIGIEFINSLHLYVAYKYRDFEIFGDSDLPVLQQLFCSFDWYEEFV